MDKRRKTFARVMGAILALFLILGILAPAFATGDVVATGMAIGSQTSGVEIRRETPDDSLGKFDETGYYKFTIDSISPLQISVVRPYSDTAENVSGAILTSGGKYIDDMWGLVLEKPKDLPWAEDDSFTIQIVSEAVGGTVTAVIDHVDVMSQTGGSISSVRRGNLIDLEATIVIPDIPHTIVENNTFTATFTSESFTRESNDEDDIRITKVSDDESVGGLATFDVYFDNLRYSGSGDSISFTMFFTAGGGEYKTTVSYSVPDTVEYTPSTGSDDDDDYDDDETEIDPLTPYIIIENYTYGGTSVTAGNEFNLRVILRNTSTTHTLENIKMSVAPTGVFSMTSSSNTFYIDKLMAGDSIERDMTLYAGLTAVTDDLDSNSIGIDFSFQYVANDIRKDGVSSESITIPVFYPDRFEYTEPSLPPEVYVGEEFNIYIPIVNKGRSTIYNLSASLVGATSLDEQTIYFGNLNAGSEESIDFYALAEMPGELLGSVVLSYEDANMNLIEREVPFNVNVMDYEPYIPDEPYPPFPDDIPTEVEPEEGMDTQQVLLSLCFVIVAATSAYISIAKVKHKRSEFDDETV